MTELSRGQEMMETNRIPAMMAPLTRYIMRKAVNTPPQKIPSQSVGFRIFPDSQVPSVPIREGLQPASSNGSLVLPVIAPIPAL